MCMLEAVEANANTVMFVKFNLGNGSIRIMRFFWECTVDADV